MNPPKGLVTRKMFPFDDVIMGWWYPYVPGLLHWHWSNAVSHLVPMEGTKMIRAIISWGPTGNDNMTTRKRKQNMTKSCVYARGCAVYSIMRSEKIWFSFSITFCLIIVLSIDSNFAAFFLIIHARIGLAPNRRQSITRTNESQDLWCDMASLDHSRVK